LIERLDEGIKRELTLISAPAGFGKTTLLSEWIHKITLPVAWVSLDKGDSDPVHFIHYLIAAMQTIESSIGKAALTVLQTPQPPPIESVLSNLINEITAIPEDFALILDDYHLVEAKQIHNMAEFLLDHLPQRMHLVIATRVDPLLPLARLRGRNQLTELRASDLSFTTTETTEFFNKVMTLGLSSADITRLESRTEGWIAGLQLAALSMQDRKDIPAFIKTFSGDDRHIVDYLAEEVLNRQPDHIRNFLLQTSILNRLTGSLCDAVTGQENGQQMLNELEKGNLFIIPLDNKRSWYRYHHLFADLLQQRLRQTQGDVVPELHKRTSEWYEQNELITEAVDHALAAEEFDRASRLVEENVKIVLMHGEVTTVLNWLEALPKEVVRAHPRLYIDHAWALYLTNRPNAVEPLLQDAERGLQSKNLDESAITSGWRGEVMVLRAWVKRCQGNLDQAIELSEQALKHLTEKQSFVRCLNILSLAGAWYYSGDSAQAIQALRECIPMCQADRNPLGVTGGAYDLAELLVIQGNLNQAIATLKQALQWVTAQGVQHFPATALLYAGIGDILREQNDLKAAEHHIEACLELSELGLKTASGQGFLSLARLKQALGDTNSARDALRKAEQAVQDWEPPQIVADLAAHRVRFCLAQGNIKAAIQWKQESGLRSDEEPTYLHEFELITLARVLIAQGKTQPKEAYLSDAIELLKLLHRTAQAGNRIGRVIEILVLQALVLKMQGDTTQAITVLEQALSLAEPEDYIRTFADEGSQMALLLEKLLNAKKSDQGDGKVGYTQAYVKKLLFAIKASPLTKTDYGLIEPLSDRELDVLNLIAAGLTNKEIANELFISLNTVGSHTKNINSKLDVHNRTEAVAKAKELGLL